MKKGIKKILSYAMIFALAFGTANFGAISNVNATVNVDSDIQTFFAVLAATDVNDRIAVVDMIANSTNGTYTYDDTIVPSAVAPTVTSTINSGITNPANQVEQTMVLNALNYIDSHYVTHSTYINYGLNKITATLNTSLGQSLENSGNGIVDQVKEKFFTYNLFLNFLMDIKGQIGGQALFYDNNNVLELSAGMNTLIAIAEGLGDFSDGGRYDTYKALFTQYLTDVNNWGTSERTPFIADLKNNGLCVDKPVAPSVPSTPTVPTAPVVTETTDGTVTTTTNQDGTKSVALEVNPDTVAQKIADKTQASVGIDLTASKGADSVKVEIPVATLTTIVEGNKTVTLQSEKAAIVLPVEVLQQITEVNKEGKVSINIDIVKDIKPQNAVAQAIDFTITSGDKKISQFEKPIEISMNVDMTVVKDYRKVSAYYYNETTKVWEAVGGYLNSKTGELTFEVSHFSKYTAMENNKSFADVSEQWAKDSIEVLAARNIMNGVGKDKFAPKANITRAEVAATIVRTLNINTKPVTGKFTDVASAKWYAMEVEAAANAGIISGIGNNKFAPEASITREEIVTMIARAIEYKQGKATITDTLTFVDANEISSFAKNAVALTTSKNIIKGSNNSFMPKAKATREEVAAMLYRTLEVLGEM